LNTQYRHSLSQMVLLGHVFTLELGSTDYML